MTVIRPNSVAGINSITVQSGNSLAVHKADGTLIQTITGASGVSTFSSVSVGSATTDNSAAKSINIGLGASIAQHNDNTLTFGTNGDPQVVIGADGSVTIKDSIIHDGDTNTKIRFVENDKISLETAGSERLRLDNQYLIKGHTSTYPIAGHYPSVQLTGTTFNDATFSIINNANDATGSYIYLSKQRSGSPGGATVVQDDDLIGHIGFTAGDGTDVTSRIAEIKGEIDGTPGSNDTPGRLSFWTTADGAQSSTERLRITSGGDVGIGDNNPSIRLTVVDSGTENLVRLGRSDGSGHGSHTVNIKTSKDFYHNFKMEASSYDLDCYNGSSMIDALSIDTNGQVVVQSGDLRFGSAGSGIILGNTSNADANTLDDYEEGTWTPVWSDATSGGTTSSSAQMHGHYTKIGRMVTVHFYTWGLPNQGTSNAIILQGLPFTAGVIGEVVGAVQAGYYNDGNTSTYNLVIKVTTGNTYGRLEWNSAGNNDVVAASFSGFINNYTNFTGTVTYLVA